MKAVAILSHLMNKHGVLGEQTIERTRKAVQLAKEHDCELLLTSGWDYRDDSALKIGICVRDYIQRNFTLGNCTVLSDTHSRDTVGDAFFLRVRLRRYPIENLIVVTSDYHVERTRIIFNLFFTPDVIVDIQGVQSDASDNEVLMAHERSSIEAFHSTFRCVDFADDKQVVRALNTSHPFYNGDIYPKIT